MDFRFKVIGLNHKPNSENDLTVGKTYEAKDGIVLGNDGYPFSSWAKNGATFENLQEWWKKWYELQLVEEPVLNIEQMDAVIQDYCDEQCDDCDGCAIENICDSIGGCFYEHPDECEEVFDIIQNLHKPDPNANPVNNSVNHPSHYNKGKIEVWDFISDWKLNFDRGNAIKYICRAGSKDPEKEIQDLEKAIEYINHEIKMLKGDIVNA